MRRDQLEHAIRAATEIVQQDRVIVIGSQAVLGTWHEADLPDRAVESVEVDICPMGDDDAESLADRLDGVAGEYSSFHQTHGFYVQGVGRRTAVLPPAWESRLVEVRNDNTLGRAGLCLEPHDLCAAKLIAHREKDREFVLALLDAGLIQPDVLRARLVVINDERREIALRWLRAVSK